MSEWLDLLGALVFLVGAFLCLVTAIALVRFPDVLTKMHSITKPQVLGMVLVATGTTLTLRTWWVFAVCSVMVALQLLTSPVSATMLSRSAFRSGLVDEDLLVMNDLSDDLARAGYKLTERQPMSPTGPEADFSSADFVADDEPTAAEQDEVVMEGTQPEASAQREDAEAGLPADDVGAPRDDALREAGEGESHS
ncbi:monovalent cation/H(+) antiporter subunit G [Tessaracoccus sp. OS52]|uniref:monovalent cation/H(+) antiporter subunit G n=1 Tax=Tessaracoccus sp. OS52 TaxID=2886691 RepID=UPI001D0FA258|nr:monovalent cation/H(+) antiporter subunit G [Tessaracoccus sp. OS52]MCC2593972.1 monovalent cation/H(+) antiporter subunit G [Tessaracoccus sp. OS52]